jgi:hypothetical protein
MFMQPLNHFGNSTNTIFPQCFWVNKQHYQLHPGVLGIHPHGKPSYNAIEIQIRRATIEIEIYFAWHSRTVKMRDK